MRSKHWWEVSIDEKEELMKSKHYLSWWLITEIVTGQSLKRLELSGTLRSEYTDLLKLHASSDLVQKCPSAVWRRRGGVHMTQRLALLDLVQQPRTPGVHWDWGWGWGCRSTTTGGGWRGWGWSRDVGHGWRGWSGWGWRARGWRGRGATTHTGHGWGRGWWHVGGVHGWTGGRRGWRGTWWATAGRGRWGTAAVRGRGWGTHATGTTGRRGWGWCGDTTGWGWGWCCVEGLARRWTCWSWNDTESTCKIKVYIDDLRQTAVTPNVLTME